MNLTPSLSFPFLSFPFLSFPFLSFPFLSFPFLSPFLSFPFLLTSSLAAGGCQQGLAQLLFSLPGIRLRLWQLPAQHVRERDLPVCDAPL